MKRLLSARASTSTRHNRGDVLQLEMVGNGKLFAEKHMLYMVGGGVVYVPSIDLSSGDPTQFRNVLLFKDGAEASKFKYDHLGKFLDDTM